MGSLAGIRSLLVLAWGQHCRQLGAACPSDLSQGVQPKPLLAQLPQLKEGTLGSSSQPCCFQRAWVKVRRQSASSGKRSAPWSTET